MTAPDHKAGVPVWAMKPLNWTSDDRYSLMPFTWEFVVFPLIACLTRHYQVFWRVRPAFTKRNNMVNMILIFNRSTAPIATPVLLGVYSLNIFSCMRSLCAVFSSSPLVLLNSVINLSSDCIVKLSGIISIFFGVFPIRLFMVFVVFFSVIVNPGVMLFQKVFLIFLVMRFATFLTSRLKSARRAGKFVEMFNSFDFSALTALFGFHSSSSFLVCFNIPHYETID